MGLKFPRTYLYCGEEWHLLLLKGLDPRRCISPTEAERLTDAFVDTWKKPSYERTFCDPQYNLYPWTINFFHVSANQSRLFIIVYLCQPIMRQSAYDLHISAIESPPCGGTIGSRENILFTVHSFCVFATCSQVSRHVIGKVQGARPLGGASDGSVFCQAGRVHRLAGFGRLCRGSRSVSHGHMLHQICPKTR